MNSIIKNAAPSEQANTARWREQGNGVLWNIKDSTAMFMESTRSHIPGSYRSYIANSWAASSLSLCESRWSWHVQEAAYCIAQFSENNLQRDSLFLGRKQEVEDAIKAREMSQRNEKQKRCREEAGALSKTLGKLWLKQPTDQAKQQLLQGATKHYWIEKRKKDRSLSNSRSWSKREASTRTDDTQARRKEGTVEEEGEELAEESFFCLQESTYTRRSRQPTPPHNRRETDWNYSLKTAKRSLGFRSSRS